MLRNICKYKRDKCIRDYLSTRRISVCLETSYPYMHISAAAGYDDNIRSSENCEKVALILKVAPSLLRDADSRSCLALETLECSRLYRALQQLF